MVMHPLHDYVEKQLSDHLKERRCVVFYDPRREFAPFIAELRGGGDPGTGVATVTVGGASARLAEYRGSFFEIRAQVEPFLAGDDPERVIVYLPGVEHDRRGSTLMEIEKAGRDWEPQLKRLARNVLRQRYTDGVIDDRLAPERVTYEDLARAASDSTGEPPSILKAIFHDTPGTDALLAAWLVGDARDAEIDAKEATRELVKLVRSRLGLALPDGAPLAKLRALLLRYVLAGEFRGDLRCPEPASLESVPAPGTKEEQAAVHALALALRTSFASAYAAMADRVEAELGLRDAKIPAEALGSIDTFRFEERALLGHAGALIAGRRFGEALTLVTEREQSFWLDRDFARKAQWEASRRMAELGQVAAAVLAQLPAFAARPVQDWLAAYTSPPPEPASDTAAAPEPAAWYRLDQAQRRLEAWVASLDDEPGEKPLGVVRRLYEDACHAMVEGFTRALAKAGWTVPGALHQTKIWSEVVADRPRPVAYFFVDAMRFEMGLDLIERLPKSAEVSARPAVSVLPSITPLGMAALLPGASGSYAAVEEKGKLGARIEDVFLPDLGARRKFAAARVPRLVDLTLDELLSLQPTKLAKKVEGAQVVIVRSQEIDHAGETGFTFQARQVMDTVIDNLARAVRKLAMAGVEHSVVTADHGHLFFPTDRDESMRTSSPGGDQVELHRRCWIGRGGATPPGCVRVAASALGYASDLEFVFPTGSGVFRAGGDLAFHHGGTSLQEMVVPVLSVRLKMRESVRPAASAVSVSGLPPAVTNRIFSVALELGGQNLSLFSSPMVVRPLLMASGKQVGNAVMAVDAALDRVTGSVTLQPGKVTTVAFLLTDESAPSLRVVVQDPANDAELYRSPADIPVRLGV
jgi:hypothetical protein